MEQASCRTDGCIDSMATWDLVDLDERQSPIAKLIFDAVLEWVIS